MLNIHLINSSKRNFDITDPQQVKVPRLAGKYSSLVPISINEPIICICFSDFLDTYLTVTDRSVYSGFTEEEAIYRTSFQITYATISPGGDFLFIASEDTAFVLDIDTQELTPVKDNMDSLITNAAFRNDNKFIAASNSTNIYTISQAIPDQQGEREIPNITSLSWNPLGNWLGISHGSRLQFLEKNCCDRQFVDFEQNIISFSWSPHKDILAVMLSDFSIVILSTKNRVFYRKYVIRSEEPLIPQIYWAPNSLTLFVISLNGLLFTYDYNFTVDSNSESIFVINYNMLQISDWSRSIIPPPLCHRKEEFDSQITSITSNDEKTAIFTEEYLYIMPINERYKLPNSPVQCSTFSNDKLLFSVGNILYIFENNEINVFKEFEEFCSLISPNYFVLNTNEVYEDFNTPKLIQRQENIQQFIENESKYIIFCRSGLLLLCNETITTLATSVLFHEKLLSYIDITNQIYINYNNNKTQHQIEPQAQLLYFTKKIHSIITQMDRGNIEINAPHVIVESYLSKLIADHQYIESLTSSKKYQIPFSRFIQLGDISIPKLCEQISNQQLRQFLACLTPLKNETDLKFILNFLTLLFGNEIQYDKEAHELNIPKYDNTNELLMKFSDSINICFILLNEVIKAIEFSCSFNDSNVIKSSINFLLTLYDNDSLFDLSYKTYDTKCIATIGLLTMKEPSSYVPFIEKINKIENVELRKALIDEECNDYVDAIKHYSKCGQEYEEKCLYIINRDHLYDIGLESFPNDSNIWKEIIHKKLEYLIKNNRPLKEISLTAIQSNDTNIIMENIKSIIKSNQLPLIISKVDQSNYEIIKNILIEEKQIENAAYFSFVYLKDFDESKKLYMEAHKWLKALECGATQEEVAIGAYNILIDEMKKNIINVNNLKRDLMI